MPSDGDYSVCPWRLRRPLACAREIRRPRSSWRSPFPSSSSTRITSRRCRVGPFTADLTDVAILAAVVAAGVDGIRHGFEPLRGHRVVWLSLVGFQLLVLASLLWAHQADPGYGLRTTSSVR